MSMMDAILTLLSFAKHPKKRPLIKQAYKLKGQTGLEVGGPTILFGLKGIFPVYLFAQRIDNVNYGTETFFGNYKKGKSFRYHKEKVGWQYIAEASELTAIEDSSYDFLLSSHSLEHVANPIKALKEWKRIIRPGGKLVLILPDKRYTFDNRREYTSLAHLVEDYNRGTDENDTTHLEEILSTFDEEAAKVQLREYSTLVANNYSNRCAHHHVFSQEVIRQMLEFAGFKVEAQYEYAPFHLITIATR